MYKILVVDDEINYIKTIVQILIESKEPYMLYQALNGELAYKIAVLEQPDLIISDWEMPMMSGIDLIIKLKQNDVTSDIPVVMCTGVMTNSENLQTALMSGAVDFIRKPIDKLELVARVKSMLEISNSRKVLKENLNEIQSKNNLIQAIVENIPHPFVYYDLDGQINGYNRRFEDLVGLSNQKLVGKLVYDYLDDAKTGIHLKQDLKLKCEREDVTYEFNLNNLDFVFSKTLFCDSQNELEEIMCMLTDITELKQAHNDILENKKRELTLSALRMIQVSELNYSLISDLSQIRTFTNKNGNELIRQSIAKFNINTGENFWREFESRFESVYESFYDKLNKLFPDITPGEKKLCALLRLNLTSKEIAAITFQNSQSVDMARYRLRKKMNLKQDENLVDMLLNL